MKNLKLIFVSCFIAGMSTGYTQDYFVTTWDTGSGTSILLPMTGVYYDVDIGNDGTFEMTNLLGTQTIDLGTSGTHTIAIRNNEHHIADRNRLQMNFDIHDMVTGSRINRELISIDNWGSAAWISMENAFYRCINMTLSDTAGAPNLTRATSMYAMFWRAESFNGNVSSWDVSNITNMSLVFAGARSFNGDLSSWDVSNATTIGSMFNSATSFNNDSIGSWNVSNVTSMSNTFAGARSFNGDLSSWDVSNVTNMGGVFREATSFNGDLSSWNVSNVSHMNSIFRGATSFNGDISSWNVSNVSNMGNMFRNATSFSSENYDALLTGWASLPSLQPNVSFQAPPTTYCAGKAGRDKLTRPVADGGYGWTIYGDIDGGCSVTSTDEELLSNTKIYPNPTRGKLTIESSFEIDKLELYNILGAKLFSVSKTNALDLTSLRQGIYILKFFSEDRVISKKIIKD